VGRDEYPPTGPTFVSSYSDEEGRDCANNDVVSFHLQMRPDEGELSVSLTAALMDSAETVRVAHVPSETIDWQAVVCASSDPAVPERALWRVASRPRSNIVKPQQFPCDF
jgi:hypothetical protein